MAPRIFLSAGEPSGDLHGGALVTALRRRWPDALVESLGGPRIRAAGAVIRFAMEQYTVMGFVEVLGKVPAHLRLLRTLESDFAAGKYDLAILIDYPGFHVRVAEAARRHGVKVLYYIAPQLWAWRPGRAKRLAGAVDRLAAVLPFEPAFFTKHGIVAEYVGHPLLDRAPLPARAVARQALGFAPDERVLGLFPGSRHQEVHRLWTSFRGAALRLLDMRVCDRVVVAGTATGEYPGAERFVVHRGLPDQVFAAADAALAKSGTTTLEAALADLPMVVAYRVHPLTSWLARQLITVPWISLVNLVAEAPVVEELVQSDASPERLAAARGPSRSRSGPTAAAQRTGLAEVRRR
ncbi:MAG: lipid-A-disaccharide synthase, partial [Gemmatimonadales bacterium]|nr:lipid-A-disaccharide synthase [Gemmatimonadales bacterium]